MLHLLGRKFNTKQYGLFTRLALRFWYVYDRLQA